MDTIWILGDQLSRTIASLSGRKPSDARVLLVESRKKIDSKAYHRQRLHLVLTAMRRFARDLESEGFEVDYVEASDLATGLSDHRARHRPDRVIVMEPMSYSMRRKLEQLDVTIVRSNQFLCHYADFKQWAQGRKGLVMEDFYREQRRRLGYLMDGDEPAGGAWNFDAYNREPPPRDGRQWPQPLRSRLDEIDERVIDQLPSNAVGQMPDGTWATSRRAALARLRNFVENVLPSFGPHEDAMLTGEWSMAHSTLSPYLNLGLLHPAEVCDAAEAAFRAGKVPIQSAEGFIRQIIGWREYVWGVYWLWMPEYAEVNALEANRPLPPYSRRATLRCGVLRKP